MVLFGSGLSALAADHGVSTSGLSFVPATLSIPAGDTVTWDSLAAGFHTTTSSDGLWNSSSDGFSFEFDTAGTYNYVCLNHQGFGMVGTITVTAVVANVPPTISINSPATGKVFSAPANITIVTAPADSDGTITNVQFRVGASILGNKSSAPFSMIANNLAAADYVLSAVASDNNGAQATNSVTVHVINASPIALASPTITAAPGFQFLYSTDTGLGYVIETSTNLLNWKPIATNSPASANPATFVDSLKPTDGAFYRVGRMPNP